MGVLYIIYGMLKVHFIWLKTSVFFFVVKTEGRGKVVPVHKHCTMQVFRRHGDTAFKHS